LLVSPALGAERGYFGAWFGDLPVSETAVKTGVIVKKVYAGMAAEKAGLKEGEIVTRINGVLAPDPPTAVELLADNAAGEKVRLTVIEKTGGGFRSFNMIAIMGDKPTAEFGKLKKTYVRCPSPNARFCNSPANRPDHGNDTERQSGTSFTEWVLFLLFAFVGIGVAVNQIWRIKTSVK
jgi:hypothetical protein